MSANPIKSLKFNAGYILLGLIMNVLAMNAQKTPQKMNDSEDALKQFQAVYERELRSSPIVGSSFMFIKDGKVAAKNFYGTANLEKNQPVDENTIYHWASITKTLTGIAIMQLRDRGFLRLDDPAIKYLPELRAVHNPRGEMSEITIRHLLSHSAGFRNPTFPWGGDKDWHPHEPQDWAQLVAMFPYTEIEFKPGSRYSYSNPGIVFLGRIIETITKDDYEVYIDKNIFKPLEMYRSYFDATPYHLLKYRSHSYYMENGKLKPARFDVNTGITVSNGGLNAPLTDMVKYLNFLIGDEQKQEVYDDVLKRSSLEEMWQPAVEIHRNKENPKNVSSMGLTFFIDDENGQRYISHSGNQNGFLAFVNIHPKKRIASVTAFNTNLQLSDKTPDEKNPVVMIMRAQRKLFESIDTSTK
ncbi:MAG TPA: serine hydrolase domain-containing protein [Pyrinomonadaceae bacterium]|nr:serine hydrolase domain-containing protein [Pyrinomonadaceae bacterium]